MKRYLAILALSVLTACNSTVVEDMKCENLADPLAIDNTAPHFSWKLSSAKKGESQRFYRIHVSRDSLFRKDGLLWDSGKIQSAESVMVPYGGSSLASRDMCWWRVRVWTGTGASQWSPAARFGIGLTDAGDIEGTFIGYPSSGKTAVLLRKSFTVEKTGAAALLHVNSLGYHEVYINGGKVSGDVLSPAISQMNKRPLWVTYDVTALLRQGGNELVVWLGQGWYKKNTFGRWEDNEPYSEPLVRAQLDVQTAEEWNTVCATDATWQARLSGYTDTGSWNALDFGGELVDARLNPADMRSETLDALEWSDVITAVKPQYNAAPQMCEPNRIRETLIPVTAEDLGGGSWYLDIGKVITGWFELPLFGLPAGHTVEIEYSDEISMGEDGMPSLLDQRQRDTYIARGGSETFINKFNHHAFRYVRISNLPVLPPKESIKAHLIHTDYAAASSFECSDAGLNAIHDMVFHTMKCLAYSGYMVDCPHLERAGYGGDGNSSTETLQTMYDVAPLYANWVQSWSDAMRPGGSLPHVAPNAGAGGGGPYWCGFIVMAPWQTYLNYGDRRLIEKYYPAMQEWLGYVDEYTVDGLLARWPDTEYRDWFLGDWLAPDGVDTGNPASISLVNNCFISDCFAKMEKMASMLGRTGDAEMYAQKREALNRLLHGKFFNPADNTYATGSQLDMTYPMLVGVTPDSLYPKVQKQLFDYTASQMKGHIGGGLVGVPVITKWAIDNRAVDWMYSMLKKRDYPGYLHMIDNGATATWEYWNGERSRVHNCYNGIGMWFYQAVGGLRTDPDAPGYRHVIIEPQIPTGVTWCKITKATPYGMIKLDWKIDAEGQLHMDVSLPPGVTATVAAPYGMADCIPDGRTVPDKAGNIVLESGRHRIASGPLK